MSLERMRESYRMGTDACYRLHVEVAPDKVFVGLFDALDQASGGRQIWHTAFPRPAEKTAAEALAAALRAALTDLERGLA